MSDTTDTAPVVDQVEGTPDVPTAPTQDNPNQSPADSVDQLPDWAKKLVSDLRKENAGHRKAKQAAETAAEEAARKAAEEQGEFKRLYEEEKSKREQAEAAKKAAELAHLKAKVSAKHNLPQVLADRLTGETEEELEADALILLEALPTPSIITDASNGSNTTAPTPALTDGEIREQAARLGVSFEHLKNHLMKGK